MNDNHLWITELNCGDGWFLGKQTFRTRKEAREFIKHPPFENVFGEKLRVAKFIRADLVKQFCNEIGENYD